MYLLRMRAGKIKMANRTQKDVQSVKGTNPQYLVEKIIRTRIYDSKYWKEQCFGLSAELLVDKAMELESVGGIYGANIQPSNFLCLVLKMLQIQPTKDIVIEFIKNPDYKYVRVLGALYLRLVGTSLEVYNYLEPLYNDYRKLKIMNRNGQLQLSHVDEFVDQLLRNDRCCDIILPRIQKRYILEQLEQLEPRVSALDEDLEADDDDEEEEEDEEEENSPPPPPRRRTPSPHRDRRHHSPNVRSPQRRSRSRSPGRRRRSYSRSPRRHRHRSPSPRRHGRRHSRSPSPRERERRERERRERDRERDRGGGGRDRDRERGREREDKERDRDKERERGRDKEREKERGEKKSKEDNKSKEKKKKKKKDKELSKEEEEIKQANELRAKLGLKPLRP